MAGTDDTTRSGPRAGTGVRGSVRCKRPKLSRSFNKVAKRKRHKSKFIGEGEGALVPELPLFPSSSRFLAPPRTPEPSRFLNPPKPGTSLRLHFPPKPCGPSSPKK